MYEIFSMQIKIVFNFKLYLLKLVLLFTYSFFLILHIVFSSFCFLFIFCNFLKDLCLKCLCHLGSFCKDSYNISTTTNFPLFHIFHIYVFIPSSFFFIVSKKKKLCCSLFLLLPPIPFIFILGFCFNCHPHSYFAS